MSTYNGSLYIVEQINSILAQNDVNVKIIIRDDGSQDDTVSKINELKAMHPNSIFLIEGNNVGYRKSFLNLFKYISEADYYCFSDQDDFWKPNKIINAINILSNAENIGLYASSLTLTDEHLNTLSQKTYNNRTFSLQSFFIRTQLAGCTYVFKPKIANFAKEFCELNYSSEEMPDHDALICIITKSINMDIFIDSSSYILHRRLENSQTAGKNFYKRLTVEIKRITRRKFCFQNTATEILNSSVKDYLTNDNLKFLINIKLTNINILNRINLIFDKLFSTGNIILDFVGRIKLILKKY